MGGRSRSVQPVGSVMGGDLGISECPVSGLSGLSDGGRSWSVQPVGSVMGGDLGVSSQWAQWAQ